MVFPALHIAESIKTEVLMAGIHSETLHMITCARLAAGGEG